MRQQPVAVVTHLAHNDNQDNGLIQLLLIAYFVYTMETIINEIKHLSHKRLVLFLSLHSYLGI